MIEAVSASGRALLNESAPQVLAAGLTQESQMLETLSTRPRPDPGRGGDIRYRADRDRTHARRGLSYLLLGSDAEQVLRQSSVTMLLVRGQPEPGMAAVDRGEGAARALQGP